MADRMPKFGAAMLLAGVAVAGTPAQAQRANENVVTSADDAFGTSIGNESVGLYSSDDVRGFSPSSAGNDRLEGIYFDRRASLTQRTVSGSTIRVGIAAQGYPFPAPTGIVDYHLRPVGDRRITSIVTGFRKYMSPFAEVDAQLPLLGETLGLAAGASYTQDKRSSGSEGSTLAAAANLRWRPAPGVEIIPFWGGTKMRKVEQGPYFLSGGNYLPPVVPRRHTMGQNWANFSINEINTGLIVKALLDEHWAISGGGFYSAHSHPLQYTQMFVNIAPDGMADKRVTSNSGHRSASKSGEVRIARTFQSGEVRHRLIGSVRARQVQNHYDNNDILIAIGRLNLEDQTQIPKPGPFTYQPHSYDDVVQTTFGLTYEARFRDLVNLSVAMQKTRYRKSIRPVGEPELIRITNLWLPSVSLSVTPTPELAFYADYTKGLEESAQPPFTAVNHSEVMPAIQTKQKDAGVRWTFVPGATLVAGYFDIEKPYLNIDNSNVFGPLGQVRHRGFEFSLTTSPIENLNIVAGAVLMKPRVSGPAVDIGRVGEKPVGTPATTWRGSANYQLPFLPAVSLDAALAHTGEQFATNNNLVRTPAYTLVDLGARYRFHIAYAPATLRVQVQNIGDVFAWQIVGNGTYNLMDGRRVQASIAADF